MTVKLRLRWRDRRPPFVYPFSITGRTVVFEPLFRRSSGLLYVEPESDRCAQRVQEFRPAALAGRRESVMAMRGQLEPGWPSHAIVIFTREGELCLTESERDELWDAFQVPVFEQVINGEGRLAAWECEAHSGLHLAEGAQPPAGCLFEPSVCGCGDESPRIAGGVIAPRLHEGAGLPSLLIPARIRSAARPIPT